MKVGMSQDSSLEWLQFKVRNLVTTLEKAQMKKIEGYFKNVEKIVQEKERTNEILDKIDTCNQSLDVRAEVVIDLTVIDEAVETNETADPDKFDCSAFFKSAERPVRPFSSFF